MYVNFFKYVVYGMNSIGTKGQL